MENIENKFFHGISGATYISDLEILELILEDKKIMNSQDIRRYHSTYQDKIGFDDYLLRKAGVRYAAPDEVCLCYHPRNYELSCKQGILCNEPDSNCVISNNTFLKYISKLFYSNILLEDSIRISHKENGYYAFIDQKFDCLSLILSEELINNQTYNLYDVHNNFPKTMIYEIRVKGSIDLEQYLVGIGYSNPLDYLFLLDEYPFLESYFKKELQKNNIDNLLNHYSDKVKRLYALLERFQYNNIPIVNPYSGIDLIYPDEDYQQKIKEYAKKF